MLNNPQAVEYLSTLARERLGRIESAQPAAGELVPSMMWLARHGHEYPSAGISPVLPGGGTDALSQSSIRARSA